VVGARLRRGALLAVGLLAVGPGEDLFAWDLVVESVSVRAGVGLGKGCEFVFVLPDDGWRQLSQVRIRVMSPLRGSGTTALVRTESMAS
jgi:hypothetical protein